MKHRGIYLAASLASLAKPFLAGFMAVQAGMANIGGFPAAFLSFLVFPQIIPAVCLFFIYLDSDEYHSFRPLVALFAICSLALSAMTAVSAFRNPEKTVFLSGSGTALAQCALALLSTFLVDLFDVIVILCTRKRQASVSGSIPATKDEK